ncbi:MAG: hypothetical protein SynsKO_34590 [Synoicihabitans sp.]
MFKIEVTYIIQVPHSPPWVTKYLQKKPGGITRVLRIGPIGRTAHFLPRNRAYLESIGNPDIEGRTARFISKTRILNSVGFTQKNP